MKFLLYSLFALTTIFGLTTQAHAQVSSKPVTLDAEPWKESQLLEPSVLGKQLKTNTLHALILNIGTGADIKDAKHIGPASENENIEKLRKAVASLPKNMPLIIYCGCCPLHNKCPNAKPAFNELTRLGFTDIKVLNLVTNLKTNWINEGYPLTEK